MCLSRVDFLVELRQAQTIVAASVINTEANSLSIQLKEVGQPSAAQLSAHLLAVVITS